MQGKLCRVVIRPIREDDDLVELTEMLHRAYAPLAERGMRYLATHQSVEITGERVREGETYFAEFDGRVVGTITLTIRQYPEDGTWQNRSEVATFHQFAVDPDFQGSGIGTMLLKFVEDRSKQLGARELSLDTSEQADDLIALYEHKGFRFVEHVRWSGVNYRSVVMSKTLA